MPTLTTLLCFNDTSGHPGTGLITNAAGDLFGTTESGTANQDGIAFEIANTGIGYAGTPTILVSFYYTSGGPPYAGLITNAAGDLFGTTGYGGTIGEGSVFEIANTRTGYAGTPTTLVSFNGTNGADPYAGLIADAAGNLFGTTSGGGANGDGSVFEIANTGTGYASTPTTLVSFNDTNGYAPKRVSPSLT